MSSPHTHPFCYRGSALRGAEYDKVRNILQYMENKITGANAQEAFEQPFLSQLFSDIGPPSESQSITLSSSSSKPVLFPSEADESREEQKGEERSTPLSMPTPLQPTPKLT